VLSNNDDVNHLHIALSTMAENAFDGINLDAGTNGYTIRNAKIVACSLWSNSNPDVGGTSNTRDGIRLIGSAGHIDNLQIISCNCPGGLGDYQAYGINIFQASRVRHLRVIGGSLEGNLTGALNYDETPIDFKAIEVGGYVTKNRGTATIPAGNTSVTVNHGLAKAPSKVLVTPIGDPGTRWWVDNITDTSFDIFISVAQSVDVKFMWQAEV